MLLVIASYHLVVCLHLTFFLFSCYYLLLCSCNIPYFIAPPVRLVGGRSRCSGRVEVYLHGQWGTVCDDYFDVHDARVICRQLRCPRDYVVAYSRARFGRGRGPIWLDNVRCTGSEADLFDCPHIGTGCHNCRHSDDAGVACKFDQ